MTFTFHKTQLNELQSIRKRDYNDDLTRQEVSQMADQMFDLFEWMQELIQSGRIDHLIEQTTVDDNRADSV